MTTKALDKKLFVFVQSPQQQKFKIGPEAEAYGGTQGNSIEKFSSHTPRQGKKGKRKSQKRQPDKGPCLSTKASYNKSFVFGGKAKEKLNQTRSISKKSKGRKSAPRKVNHTMKINQGIVLSKFLRPQKKLQLNLK